METRTVIFAIFIVQAVQPISPVVAIQCMHCDGASSVDDCKLTMATCGPNESCFLEKVTTAQLTVLFNAGCRSKTVCGIMSSLSGVGKRSVQTAISRGVRSGRELISCADCCNSLPNQHGPCNSQLCGQKPSLSDPPCRVCDSPVIDAIACQKKEACQPTQVCHTGIRYINSAIRYVFGCEERHLCASLIKNERVNHTSRANTGLNLCDACCVGDDCNAVDCFALKRNMTLQSIGASP